MKRLAFMCANRLIKILKSKVYETEIKNDMANPS